MAENDSVIVFIRHDRRVLLLRPADADTAPWDGLRRERDGASTAQAYAMIDEAFGLTRDDVGPPVQGDSLYVGQPGRKKYRRLHPILFDLHDAGRLALDRTRVERRWAWPAEIDALDTTPGLADALHRVYVNTKDPWC